MRNMRVHIPAKISVIRRPKYELQEVAVEVLYVASLLHLATAVLVERVRLHVGVERLVMDYVKPGWNVVYQKSQRRLDRWRRVHSTVLVLQTIKIVQQMRFG